MAPRQVTVFAPATVANVGPGFDALGLALETPGDRVVARRVDDQPGVRLTVTAAAGRRAPPADDRNTASVAARQLLARLGAGWGVELALEKGLPIGSGLGSSGASAAAAAAAVNHLADAPLPVEALVACCAEAERAACGAPHADNVAPALLGGVVLVRPDGSTTRVETGLDLHLALVTPEIELPTRAARAALPAAIPVADAVHNAAHLATLVYALATDDAELLARAVDDRVAEPHRAAAIPGFAEVKGAALAAGALGCSISGAGPSIFALCHGPKAAERALAAMRAALEALGVAHEGWVSPLGRRGAVRVDARG